MYTFFLSISYNKATCPNKANHVSYLSGDHGGEPRGAIERGFPVEIWEVEDEKHGGLSERSSSGEAPAALIDGPPAAHAPTPARVLFALEEEDLHKMPISDCT